MSSRAGQPSGSGSSSAPSHSEGVLIGNYIVKETLGQGTFGKVKLGIHALTKEKVAVKILEKAKIREVADAQRVAREIKILKRIRHANVIQLFEVIDTPKQILLVMEHLDSGELFDYIVKHQKIREDVAVRFFHDVVDGLAYLHKREVAHRDLKPENILMDRRESGYRLKIIDFGLSNTFDGGKTLKTACGSPCYAAPELLTHQPYRGDCADIWSLGVVLFAMVCGYLPYEDANTAKLYDKILRADYKPPRWISNAVRDLIARIFVTDPARRFTIADIRRHPWYSQLMVPTSPLKAAPSSFSDLNPVVLAEVEKLGVDRATVGENLFRNAHNNITATYYLIAEKLLRKGELAPVKMLADVSSADKVEKPRERSATEHLPSTTSHTVTATPVKEATHEAQTENITAPKPRPKSARTFTISKQQPAAETFITPTKLHTPTAKEHAVRPEAVATKAEPINVMNTPQTSEVAAAPAVIVPKPPAESRKTISWVRPTTAHASERPSATSQTDYTRLAVGMQLRNTLPSPSATTATSRQTSPQPTQPAPVATPPPAAAVEVDTAQPLQLHMHSDTPKEAAEPITSTVTSTTSATPRKEEAVKKEAPVPLLDTITEQNDKPACSSPPPPSPATKATTVLDSPTKPSTSSSNKPTLDIPSPTPAVQKKPPVQLPVAAPIPGYQQLAEQQHRSSAQYLTYAAVKDPVQTPPQQEHHQQQQHQAHAPTDTTPSNTPSSTPPSPSTTDAIATVKPVSGNNTNSSRMNSASGHIGPQPTAGLQGKLINGAQRDRIYSLLVDADKVVTHVERSNAQSRITMTRPESRATTVNNVNVYAPTLNANVSSLNANVPSLRARPISASPYMPRRRPPSASYGGRATPSALYPQQQLVQQAAVSHRAVQQVVHECPEPPQAPLFIALQVPLPTQPKRPSSRSGMARTGASIRRNRFTNVPRNYPQPWNESITGVTHAKPTPPSNRSHSMPRPNAASSAPVPTSALMSVLQTLALTVKQPSVSSSEASTAPDTVEMSVKARPGSALRRPGASGAPMPVSSYKHRSQSVDRSNTAYEYSDGTGGTSSTAVPPAFADGRLIRFPSSLGSSPSRRTD